MECFGRRMLTGTSIAAALLGIVLGIVLTLAALVALAPQRSGAPVAQTAQPYDVAVTVGDTYLTSALSDAVTHGSLPVAISNIRAHADSGNTVQVSGDVSNVPTFAGNGQRSLTASLMLSATSGQLHAQVEQASIGGLNLPTPATSALERAIDQQLASTTRSLAGGDNYALVGVNSSPGHLTLLLKHR